MLARALLLLLARGGTRGELRPLRGVSGIDECETVEVHIVLRRHIRELDPVVLEGFRNGACCDFAYDDELARRRGGCEVERSLLLWRRRRLPNVWRRGGRW